MSCYQVLPDQIDLIVSELFRGGGNYRGIGDRFYFDVNGTVHTDAMRDRIEPCSAALPLSVISVSSHADADAVGRELVAANVASVRFRYPGADEMVGYLPEAYSFRRVTDDRFATAGHVLGAVAGFRYQSCERGDERGSLWGSILAAVERRAIERVAGDSFGEGWSWSRDWQADQIAAARAAILSAVRS
jgi:hypothetical protein